MPYASSRRLVIATMAAALSLPVRAVAGTADESAPSPPLAKLIKHPLLVSSLYQLPVGRAYSPDGAAGANRDGYRWIEEQRQGAEWIVRGMAEGRAGWRELGWRQLDWGLAHQAADGGFDSADPFHSTSFFIEALARSCLLDPAGVTAARRDGLARGARWLMSPRAEAKGVPNNRPYTHRRYILAAAFGQAAAVTGDAAFAARAAAWAHEGLGLQRADGTDPERDGYDAGYQMVGVLMALRYLPVCDDPGLRTRLRAMVRMATAPELARLQPDGSIDINGSTRIGKETSRSGRIKDLPYGEIMQALVFGVQALPEPAWLQPAERIARGRKWLKT